jgi:2',3'-cyclic-nucleotide 2'-phosphodiesterase (5'-nucleotidase family)
VIVDAGNVLFKRVTGVKKLTQKIIAAQGIATIYKEMNYEAIAVGPYDLSGGLDLLQNPPVSDLPWISANIYDPAGSRIFTPFKTIFCENLKIGLIGLTGKLGKETDGYDVTDGNKELEIFLPKITQTHDLVILLSSLSHKQNIAIAQSTTHIDIIIGADKSKGTITPHLINETLITQTESQGKYLGFLAINWRHNHWQEDLTKKRALLHNQLAANELQSKRLHARKKVDTQIYREKQENLKKSRQRILVELADIERKVGNSANKEIASSYSSAIFALRPSIPDDADILMMINSIKDEIRLASREFPHTSGESIANPAIQ